MTDTYDAGLIVRLGWLERIADPSVRARAGGNLIRQWAFIQWCSFCQDDDHWNHRRPDGGCRAHESITDRDCICPWRETS